MASSTDYTTVYAAALAVGTATLLGLTIFKVLVVEPANTTTIVASKSQDISPVEPFSAVIKESTKVLHKQAESRELIKLIFSARISWNLYLQYLLALYPVYLEMEKAMQSCRGHPVIKRFYFPNELNRAELLDKDIRFLMQGSDESVIQDALTTHGPAVTAYCDRIRRLGETDPTLLIAHTYARYLGDLSGGQMIKQRISKALGLETGAGLDFYEFPNISTAHNDFKNMYRGLLDKLETDAALNCFLDKQAFIQEAKKSFVFNIELFEEVMPSA
ncbi:Heme oxygenase 2 [Chytriomyces hyalinus]|nr:Heme oxygenase 2 [Chytriomyces hyalinus]